MLYCNDSKEIKPFNSRENQPWICIERTDAEAPILWLPDGKSWLIGKHPDTGEIEGKRRRWQRRISLDAIINSMDTSLSKLQEKVKDKEAWCAATCGATNNWTGFNEWTIVVMICVLSPSHFSPLSYWLFEDVDILLIHVFYMAYYNNWKSNSKQMFAEWINRYPVLILFLSCGLWSIQCITRTPLATLVASTS